MLHKYLDPKELQVAQEAIDSQGKSKLFVGLTDVFRRMQNDPLGIKNSANHLKDIQDVVRKTTKIKLNCNVDKSREVNAWVYPPDIDKNNPVLTDFSRMFFNGSAVEKRFKNKEDMLVGRIDRVSSTVGGVFTKIPIRVFVTAGLVYGKRPQMMPEEIAAIFIHEIGHIFTYFEYMGTYITTNFVLQNSSKRLLGTQETSRKYEILKETEQLLKIELEDKDSLTKMDNETVIQTVILHANRKTVVNELGSKTYDLTAYEMLSDQFAARHGSGKALTKALGKIYKLYGTPEFMTDRQFFINQVELVVAMTALGVLSLGIIPLLMLFFFDPTANVYDDPFDRVKRIRNDIVAQIKESDSKEYKDYLMGQLESMDKLLSQMTPRKDLLTKFALTFRFGVKSQMKQKLLQKELEDMVNNDLFVLSHKFDKRG